MRGVLRYNTGITIQQLTNSISTLPLSNLLSYTNPLSYTHISLIYSYIRQKLNYKNIRSALCYSYSNRFLSIRVLLLSINIISKKIFFQSWVTYLPKKYSPLLSCNLYTTKVCCTVIFKVFYYKVFTYK